jgi:valyl-tRNA synthetase
MELSKNYDPAKVEEKWYKHWKEKGYFHSHVDERPSFTVVIPPPNVTGVLHMGHTLNETVQDILVRRARMTGYNTCWVPGSDHASIATEAKVVEMLKKEKGIDKSQLTREEFLKYAFEWKDKYGGIIYHQIEKLGCSVDWNRVSFTMDPHYYKAVIKVFVDLYNKKKIYRGARMINWDPSAKTALSDEEVEYKDVQGTLYYVKYLVAENSEFGIQNSESRIQNSGPDGNGGDYITIATQRPETIMGDTGVCVHPSDQRFNHLRGKHVIVPLVNRKVPVIFDEYVDPEFGTGALKITPAHDINDYNLGLKHSLEIIDTLNEDGTLSEAAQVYVGVDRFEARKKVITQLKQEGLLIKEEEYQTRLGFSQRTNAIVEPRISTQWFVAMRSLADMALQEVLEGGIKIHPGEKFIATYKYWLENVKDWCISRQLWWGQRIPAWYDDSGRFVVAETEEEAEKQYTALYGRPSTLDDRLLQDEDVLDTWFSSWLWPIEVFKGISNPGNTDIKYYYPTSVLVTGQDIIFFWVARMIMAGMEYMGEKPFSDVYFTGMVRDKLGRKMSKSLGNSPDLLQMIEKSGADAVRFGIMVSSPAGNDLLFDDSSPEQGRNFNNKIWNALKLVRMWSQRQGSADNSEANDASSQFAIEWFQSRLAEVRLEVDKLMSSFKLSEALKTIYSLIWDDFCSWYLEWVKPGFEQPIESSVYNKTVYFFEQLMQLLHPFMPFITEEIYHLLKERDDDLCVKQFSSVTNINSDVLTQAEFLKQDITTIRDARKKNEIKNAEQIKFMGNPQVENFYGGNKSILRLLEKQTNTVYYAPLGTDLKEYSKNEIIATSAGRTFFLYVKKEIDSSAQKEQLIKDLKYLKGFLSSVEKKLGNERFVQNAKPEVLALEQKKRADTEIKIKGIEETLSKL